MAHSTERLRIEHLGPIAEAEVQFGNLTVFVGPQATGKSLFLQMFKLLLDRGAIQKQFKSAGLVWTDQPETFLDLYLGEGMGGAYDSERTKIVHNGKAIKLATHLRGVSRANKDEQVFYIPAQRVMCLSRGLPLRFVDFQTGDPFVLRRFSEAIHQMIQTELAHGRERKLFPLSGRMRDEMRRRLNDSVFAHLELRLQVHQYQKRLVLKDDSGRELPYLVWSAGQREFTPMLLGFYWLMPSGRVSRREDVGWVVIEEPEMGLHARAILDVMALTLELIRRGYKVCLTSHSPLVLDVLWALRVIREHEGTAADVCRMLNLGSDEQGVAERALQIQSRVYYFQRDGHVRDISNLDPGAESIAESGWGGLTEFSGTIGEVVATVVNRYEQKQAS